MIKPYFRGSPGDPPPLRCRVERQVRFEEVDVLGIVWHGRYASWLEDGRTAICARHGIGYMDLYANGVLAPIKQMHIDYHHPLRFDESCVIEGVLHYSEAARINFSCTIRNQEGRVCTTGYSVQLLLDPQRNLQMTPPPFYRAFLDRWLEGRLAG